MKRFHVHLSVDNLAESINFYKNLFACEPSVQKEDYAKWMLDDPRVNFAISQRGREPGLDHMGIQVEDQSELKELSSRLKSAQMQVLDEGETTCCYAKSEKAWVQDPQGIAWETFLTTGTSTVYGDDNEVASSGATEIPMHKKSACCGPETESVQIELKRK